MVGCGMGACEVWLSTFEGTFDVRHWQVGYFGAVFALDRLAGLHLTMFVNDMHTSDLVPVFDLFHETSSSSLNPHTRHQE